MSPGWVRRAGIVASAGLLVAAVATSCRSSTPTVAAGSIVQVPPGGGEGIHLIRHVIVVMQENRSFDNYFGTFPGADGIPMKDGVPVPCLPDPRVGHCVRPFHDTSLVDDGGPHSNTAAQADVDGGRMDGFVRSAFQGRTASCRRTPDSPGCGGSTSHDLVPDSIGYHTADEIPNYWAYARAFVLQDHMFEGVRSWSEPAHLDMVSGWSAKCAVPGDPMSCSTYLGPPQLHAKAGTMPPFSWTDLTYLLHRAHVSWRYFVAPGGQPDCDDDSMFCPFQPQKVHTPDIWNPLPRFETVHQDRQVRDVQASRNYFADARAGSLPAVSWIVPNWRNSEHPPASIADGQAWVTSIVNAAMRGPEWDSTAIFLSWDDWGGFYDHVRPPDANPQGFGLRVPGLVISPYARRGFIDHQTLSTDSYLRFIEDDFLAGQRIDPSNDGRPDSRPFVAEDTPGLGDLLADFDFRRSPRPPMLLAPRPGR